MRKTYPYLQNIYIPVSKVTEETENDFILESEKRSFLKLIDNFINQRQYVKLTLLDWEENPLKSIEGEISGGSISKDGTSAVRRTCNLSCTVSRKEYNVDDMNMDFTLNKKIFIELGIKNDSKYYPEYPILWFPQGVFFITSFSMNSSSSSTVNLSLGLKDKMALLNGDVGGTFTSTTQLDTMTTQFANGGSGEQKELIYSIIQEVVHHFGGEDLNNIIIEDVPLRIKCIMRWLGENNLYEQKIASTDDAPSSFLFSLTKPTDDEENIVIHQYGDDVGYIYMDFVPQEELIAAPGDNVCTILDKIKNMLGNYEYFYDEMGIFHFREIKNFINVTQGEFLLDTFSETNYLIETINNKAIYSFEDTSNITSITVSPLYDNIKNDYVVHGIRKGDDKNQATNVLYRLVIDEKPQKVPHKNTDISWEYYEPFPNVICYTDPLDNLNKLAIPEEYENFSDLPPIGNFNKIYYVSKDDKCYYWDDVLYKEVLFKDGDNQYSISKITKEDAPKYFYDMYYPKDWRTFLYLKGLTAQNAGTDEGEYFAELAAFWPREYNLIHDQQGWEFLDKDSETNSYEPSKGNFFLDFIDVGTDLGKYAVSAIGRRKDVVQSDDINCIFEPEFSEVIFLNIDHPQDNISTNTMLNDDAAQTLSDAELLAAARRYCVNNGHAYTQVHEDIYSNLAIGGYFNSAYEKIRYELYYHTNFQKTVSLTSIPVYYLEPNSRVTINDASTNTYGDFIVKTITLTLGPGANMSVSLNEIHERL